MHRFLSTSLPGAPRRPGGRRGASLAAAATGVLLLAGCATSCSKPAAAAVRRDAPAPDAPGVVRIGQSSRDFIRVESVGGNGAAATTTVSAPARVDFRDGALSKLGAPLNGRVTKVLVRTGDRVRKGQTLVALDCPDAAAARTSVTAARASLREARADVERQHRMLDEGVGVERESLAAETRVKELESELARSEAGAAFAGPGSGGAVEVIAPLSGTVIALAATAGMTVQAGTEVVDVGDPSALWIVADVFEKDVPLLREGALARVDLASHQGPLDGRVASIGAVVATGLRTAPVRITLQVSPGSLRPGMYGRAEIAAEGGYGITLPAEAVLVKGKETIVYVEQGASTFVRRSVVVAPPVNGRIPVVSGLRAGERVATRGALLLDGAADQIL
jgi:cobalt-zinc-cadmium efflux system membrane fusion protein